MKKIIWQKDGTNPKIWRTGGVVSKPDKYIFEFTENLQKPEAELRELQSDIQKAYDNNGSFRYDNVTYKFENY